MPESRELFRFHGKPVLVLGSDHVDVAALWEAAGGPGGDMHWSKFIGDPVTVRRIQKLRDKYPGDRPMVTDAAGNIYIHKYLASSYAEDLSEDLWLMVRNYLFGEGPGPGRSAHPGPDGPPPTLAEVALSQSRALVAQERALAEHDRTIKQLASKVESIEQDRDEARRGLAALPVPPPPRVKTPTRAHVNMIVRNYAQFHGIADYGVLYNKAYRELCYRHKVNLQCPSRRDKKPIAVVEELGLMPELYAIVWEMYNCPDRLGGSDTA